jgi:hypothetical protein
LLSTQSEEPVATDQSIEQGVVTPICRYRVDCPAMSAWVIFIIVSVGLESGANQLLRWCANCELTAHRSAKAIAKSDMRVSTPFTDNDVVESLIPVTWVSTPYVSIYIRAERMTTTRVVVSRPRKENDDDSRSFQCGW